MYKIHRCKECHHPIHEHILVGMKNTLRNQCEHVKLNKEFCSKR